MMSIVWRLRINFDLLDRIDFDFDRIDRIDFINYFDNWNNFVVVVKINWNKLIVYINYKNEIEKINKINWNDSSDFDNQNFDFFVD